VSLGHKAGINKVFTEVDYVRNSNMGSNSIEFIRFRLDLRYFYLLLVSTAYFADSWNTKVYTVLCRVQGYSVG